MEIVQDHGYEEPNPQPEEHPQAPVEISVFEADAEVSQQPRHEHYSEQSGHRERGLMNRALLLASRSVDVSADVVSRGQLYLDRRLHVARYPRDGRR